MIAPPLPSILAIAGAVLVLAAIVVITRSSVRWTSYPARVGSFLSGPWAPVVAGLLTSAFVRIVWRSLHEPGVVHDERAYLLQAEIFARGHWTAPPAPLAMFFQQMHVFIEPAVFAKYPPAHALTLVPGMWLGMPGLMPMLLCGVSGALVFWIARRFSNEWIALLTWWLWTTAWPTLHWSASYFSETTSAAVWLIAVWATIRWIDCGRRVHLLVVAAALAWGLETRPLTIAVLAVPLAVVIAQRMIAARAWTTLAAPVALGAAILMLGPMWNRATLGSWRLDPYPYYSRVYFPYDKPGFGADPTPPLRPLVAEIAAVGEWSRDVHARYTLSSAPLAFAQRLITLVAWCAEGWRLVIAALMLAALLHGSKVERAGIATIALLLLAYLTFAHPPSWIVYYFEVLPVFYFLAARELGRMIQKSAGLSPEAGLRWPAPAANAAFAIAFVLLPLGAIDVYRVRGAIDRRNAFHRSADAALAGLTAEPSIVFVRYGPFQSPHFALTRNEADLASAQRWIVYDRGPQNGDLRALAPLRSAYVLDTETMHLERLP